MTLGPNPKTHEFIRKHRVARLATASSQGVPHVVPICYAYDGQHIFLALDKKPKRVDVRKLKRVRNILENPRVSVVIDDYSEDWSRLAFVIVNGIAQLIEEGLEQKRAVTLLSEKYSQYREMSIEDSPVIKITIENQTIWGETQTSDE